MNLAIVHDWLTNMGGAENVVLALCEAFPEAPIFTSVYNPDKVPLFKNKKIHTSFLQKWPWAKTKHQLFSKFRPLAFENFDFSDFDVVISSSSAEAKGIITKPSTLHICYCHTPTRYYWSDYHAYFDRLQFGLLNPLAKLMMPGMIHKLRMWDRLAADRVDHFVANSNYVAARIKKYYRRDATVIYPPVNTDEFSTAKNPSNDYFLFLSRLIPYKKADLVVETFNNLGLPLKIVGIGPELKKLRQMGKPNIEFLGYVAGEEKLKLYQNCQALIFPPEEDFGITPVETMACGKPVIAYNKGGATETVIDGKTGILFDEQTPQCLSDAVLNFDPAKFDAEKIRKHALKFGKGRFVGEIKDLIERLKH